jgi:orotate phosphoribosyltransferase
MQTASQRFVSHSLSIGALELLPAGRALRSGRVSPYFFNSGNFNDGESMEELATAYAGCIHRHIIVKSGEVAEVIYGPPYKGTVLAPTVAVALRHRGSPHIGWASSRKEDKGHGEKGAWLGAKVRGKNVIIVDDVLTTGDTKEEALQLIRHEGGNPIAVVIAFDRMERVDDSGLSASQLFTEKHKVPVYATANLDDLITVLNEDTDHPGNSPEMLDMILAYRSRYVTTD